jgi:prepilin-type N-terminal cleavage/methylation domain-containing protein
MMGRAGLTLIEMLVVTAILGLLLAGLARMAVGTLQVTSLSQSQSEQLVTLKDAVGYISDQVRSSTSLFSGLTVDNSACSHTSTSIPCFALLQPTLDSSGNAVSNSYELRVYRMRLRSNLSSNFKVTNTWADSNTYFIEEYRLSCTTCPSSSSSSVSGGSWYLVADQLTLTGPSGSITPFFVDIPFGSTNNSRVTLRVRATSSLNGKQVYVPSSSILTAIVRSRNIQ